MIIDWPRSFDQQLTRYEKAASSGDARSILMLEMLTYELTLLEELDGEPEYETRSIKRVRQSGRYSVWRISHEYHSGIAVRLICWFPPDSRTVVVALVSGDKAKMGDIFYNTVGSTADAVIDAWLREREQDSS